MKPIDDPEKITQAKESLSEEIANGDLSVGQAVRRMRALTGLTQLQFAKKVAGLSVRALNEIENGKANPTVRTLNKIAHLFGYEVGFVKKSS